MMLRASIALVALLALAAGCAKEEGEPEEPRPPHCNPLVGDHCLTPWPSSFYLAADATTKTGFRVAYPREAMPKSTNDVRVDPARYNLADGFSVGSQIVVSLKGGFAADGLPGQADLATSITDKSPIAIFDMASGERVPFFAELDANAKSDEVPALIVRPQRPLAWNTRHAVVLRAGLRDRQGAEHAPPAPFRRLREGLATRDPALAKLEPRIKEVLAFLEGKGIPRAGVLLAWDFHTASREAVTANLLQIVDEGLGKLPPGGPGFAITKAVDRSPSEDASTLREVEGTFEVPSYLASDDPDSWLKLDAQGKPVHRGTQKFAFMALIPRCAESAAAPLPVLIFGHGLFSSPKELYSELHRKLDNRICVVGIATSWIGLSEPDVPAIATGVILDFSKLPRVTDQLQQAHLNTHALARLAKSAAFRARDELKVGGQAVVGDTVYYLGISNGGIQGTAFAALSRDIERFILHVAGGWWSMMMQRSSNFQVLSVMLERVYPPTLDRTLLVSLSQHLWDATDPISFAGHVLREPLPGRGKRRVLLQEARDDDQVPNIATRCVVRALGLDSLAPPVEKLHGIGEKAGPLESGYVQWDLKIPQRPPTTNVPAPKPKPEDSSHASLRLHEPAVKQMETFLKSGEIVSTCSGPCDPD